MIYREIEKENERKAGELSPQSEGVKGRKSCQPCRRAGQLSEASKQLLKSPISFWMVFPVFREPVFFWNPSSFEENLKYMKTSMST